MSISVIPNGFYESLKKIGCINHEFFVNLVIYYVYVGQRDMPRNNNSRVRKNMTLQNGNMQNCVTLSTPLVVSISHLIWNCIILLAKGINLAIIYIVFVQ